MLTALDRTPLETKQRKLRYVVPVAPSNTQHVVEHYRVVRVICEDLQAPVNGRFNSDRGNQNEYSVLGV
jgi:hypothetical protein